MWSSQHLGGRGAGPHRSWAASGCLGRKRPPEPLSTLIPSSAGQQSWRRPFRPPSSCSPGPLPDLEEAGSSSGNPPRPRGGPPCRPLPPTLVLASLSCLAEVEARQGSGQVQLVPAPHPSRPRDGEQGLGLCTFGGGPHALWFPFTRLRVQGVQRSGSPRLEWALRGRQGTPILSS